MRFKTFLNENSNTVFTFEEAIAEIKKHCGWFLTESNDRALYRGIKLKDASLESQIFFSPHPTDRRPKDSDPWFNFMFNALIDIGFHIPEIRRKSYFCIGRTHDAYTYGDVCFIFPKGDCQFLWSREIGDSYSHDYRIMQHLVTKLPFAIDRDVLSDVFMHLAHQGVDAHEWAHSPNNILAEKTRDAFETAGYTGSLDKVYSQLRDAMLTVGRDFYKSTNLDDAIKSYNEIFITKSDGYYALSLEAVKIARNKMLDISKDQHIYPENLYEWLLQQINDA